MAEKHIILFDCFCNLCNRSIRFIKKHDKAGIFRFVAIQSEEGKKLSAGHVINFDYPDSVILIENEVYYFRSDAALRIVKKLNSAYKYLYSLIFIPAHIRDFFYNLIARNRYRIFGKTENCEINKNPK